MTRSDNLYELPPGLPVPGDDGACDHLPGMPCPAVSRRSTAGRSLSLPAVATDRAIDRAATDTRGARER